MSVEVPEALGAGEAHPKWPRSIAKPLIEQTESSSPPHPVSSSTPAKLLEISKREHLVLDSGAFIRLKQIHAFDYTNVHITPGVASEIRDKAARQNLSISLQLPRISEPTDKDLAFTRRFAKLTGDLGFLSTTDIEVIALTYMLQRLTGDVSNLKSRPSSDIVAVVDSNGPNGFSWGINSAKSGNEKEVTAKNLSQPPSVEEIKHPETEGMKPSAQMEPIENGNASYDEDESTADENDRDVESLSDDGDWIGEDNFETFCVNQCGQQNCVDDDKENRMRVACVTTDFSIQNVLLQMGLSVLSIDGMRIKQAKRWTLLCRACKNVTTDTTKQFCGHCGNNALRRVPMTIDQTGAICIEEPQYKLSQRGLIYPIPQPKGGRKGDLVLCEDQLLIGGRDRLMRQQQKVLAREKAMRDPFNTVGRVS